jgi:hypothetical protein
MAIHSSTICEVKGCKGEARWSVTKLFGDRSTLKLCDHCKPDPMRRPVSMRHLPMPYDVKLIEGE